MVAAAPAANRPVSGRFSNHDRQRGRRLVGVASNVEKPSTGLGTKILIVLGLAVVAWVAFNLLGGVLRWIFSLFAYVIVAFVAFWIGRLTAKADDDS